MDGDGSLIYDEKTKALVLSKAFSSGYTEDIKKCARPI